MLKKLLDKISDKLLKYTVIIALILFVTLTILFRILAPNTNASPYGIIDFELAFNIETISIIFTAWNTNPFIFQEQILGVYLDSFLYVPSYVLLIGGIILWFSRKYSGKMQTIGQYFSLVPLIAGICDIVENIGLLSMLDDYLNFIKLTANETIPLMTSIFASVKFLLLIVSICFGLAIMIYWFINRLLKKSETQ
jgi:hypothetical protein